MLKRLLNFLRIWETIDDRGDPYLTKITIGKQRLHIFHRGDKDPDFHDHPYEFWTFPLVPYVEQVADYETVIAEGNQSTLQVAVKTQVVPAFTWSYRPANYAHRVVGRATKHALAWRHYKTGVIAEELCDIPSTPLTDDGKIFTIVRVGPVFRRWGFLKNRDGRWCWVPSREYRHGGGKHAPCEE
jgi:hypothetical protein